MQLLQTLRKIRACEGEAAAQLLLEAFVAQEVAAAQAQPAVPQWMDIETAPKDGTSVLLCKAIDWTLQTR